MPSRNAGQNKHALGAHPSGVQKSGAYGSITLGTPGTPIDMNKGNSSPSGKTKSNGVTPDSPIGGTTFCAKPAAVEKFNARSLVGEANKNLGSKTTVKTRSEKDTSGFKQGTGNTGTSMAGAPLAVKTNYSKGGSHGKQGRNVRL